MGRKAQAGLLVGGTVSCGGPQSTLDPASARAADIDLLFWWMTFGALAVFAGVVGLTLYAMRDQPQHPNTARNANRIILVGALAPTIVLAGLLTYGLSLLNESLAPAPPGSLRIAVEGEQWWWRFQYQLPAGASFETANELRLAVNEPVQFTLASSNVIHSFWIPALGGKLDLIPGRTNRLALLPNRVGRFRGVCGEYCGTGHAKMAFDVLVLSKEDFMVWRQQQQAGQAAPRP